MTTDADPMDAPVNHPLLGRRVRVLLDPGQTEPANPDDLFDTGPRPPAHAVGVLLRLAVGGEAQVRDDDGQVWHCWPELDITEEGTTDV